MYSLSVQLKVVYIAQLRDYHLQSYDLYSTPLRLTGRLLYPPSDAMVHFVDPITALHLGWIDQRQLIEDALSVLPEHVLAAIRLVTND
jgi:hypothetical protein